MSKVRDARPGGIGPALESRLIEVATALREICYGYMHPPPAC